MILFDRKKALTQIMGDKGREEKSSLATMAEELIASLEANDVSGVVSALRAFVAECTSESPTEEG